jgi:hypothetical protein
MLARFKYILFASLGVFPVAGNAHSQPAQSPDRVIVSYPNKSITSFPILETAQRRGFFQKET